MAASSLRRRRAGEKTNRLNRRQLEQQLYKWWEESHHMQWNFWKVPKVRFVVDLVFSIYENLPREACDALEAMGVLRPGVDRYSIERIARNYLNTFQSTLSDADNKWRPRASVEPSSSICSGSRL